MPKKPVDITPEDSVVPVFLVEPTKAEKEQHEKEVLEFEQRQNEKIAKKQAALKKLEKLGLTEEDILAILSI